MRVTILPRSEFDYTSLPAGTATAAIQLCQNVDVSRAGRGVLRLRVHSATLPTGSSFRLDGRAVAPTAEDPTKFFRSRVITTAVVTSATVAPPQVIECPIADGFGACAAFFLTATQGATPSTFTFTISAELELEDHVSEWSPLELGSRLRLWVDEHDLIAVSGAYSDWGDQSPAANDFGQATSTLRPLTGASLNEWAAPDFDGSNDYFGSNALSAFVQASAYHVFAVFRADKIVGQSGTPYLNDAVIADVGAWWGLYLKNENGVFRALGFHWGSGAHTASAGGLKENADTLVEWSYDGSTLRVQVGGEAVATAAGTSIGHLLEAVRIGGGPSGSVYLDGRVASIIVCNAYLTQSERLSVRGYLAAKYGVAS